jgi:hypothetical protein
MGFSVDSTVRQILADERAKAILDKYLPGASTHPQIGMGMGMTLREISFYPQSGLTREKLAALDADLKAI